VKLGRVLHRQIDTKYLFKQKHLLSTGVVALTIKIRFYIIVDFPVGRHLHFEDYAITSSYGALKYAFALTITQTSEAIGFSTKKYRILQWKSDVVDE